MKNKCATACNFVRANQFTSKDARPYRSFEIATGPRLYLVHVVSRMTGEFLYVYSIVALFWCVGKLYELFWCVEKVYEYLLIALFWFGEKVYEQFLYYKF